MPERAAADLMVRRGEVDSFHRALGRLRKARRDYGRTEIKQSDADARARVESPRHYRLPYKDE